MQNIENLAKTYPIFHTLSFDLENKVEGKHNICIDPQLITICQQCRQLNIWMQNA